MTRPRSAATGASAPNATTTTDDPVGRPSPVTGRGRRTRGRLVEAARSVFETTSFDQAKVTDITARAGVSTGTFYTYFDTKEEIFREIAADVLAEMAAAPVRRDDDPTDERRAIAASTRRYFEVCVANSRIARSIEQLAGVDDPVATSRRNTVLDGVARSERWIRGLQKRGRCDADIDAWATALTLHTMTVRIAYDHLLHPGGDADLERLVDAVSLTWVRAVGVSD